MKKPTRQAYIRKTATLIIVVNALQVTAIALLLVLQFWAARTKV